jgi:hypothetical protein
MRSARSTPFRFAEKKPQWVMTSNQTTQALRSWSKFVITAGLLFFTTECP